MYLSFINLGFLLVNKPHLKKLTRFTEVFNESIMTLVGILLFCMIPNLDLNSKFIRLLTSYSTRLKASYIVLFLIALALIVNLFLILVNAFNTFKKKFRYLP